jgi:hypothetical protein
LIYHNSSIKPYGKAIRRVLSNLADFIFVYVIPPSSAINGWRQPIASSRECQEGRERRERSADFIDFCGVCEGVWRGFVGIG